MRTHIKIRLEKKNTEIHMGSVRYQIFWFQVGLPSTMEQLRRQITYPWRSKSFPLSVYLSWSRKAVRKIQNLSPFEIMTAKYVFGFRFTIGTPQPNLSHLPTICQLLILRSLRYILAAAADMQRLRIFLMLLGRLWGCDLVSSVVGLNRCV